MRPLPKIVVAAGSAGLAVGAGMLLLRWLKADTAGTLLMALGGVMSLVHAGAFQVIRHFDSISTDALPSDWAAKLEGKLLRRRASFRAKWLAAIAFPLAAVVLGVFLRDVAFAVWHAWLQVAGAATLLIGLGFAALVAVEYAALSKLAYELPRHIKRKRAIVETRQRLEVPEEVAAEPSVTPAAGRGTS